MDPGQSDKLNKVEVRGGENVSYVQMKRQIIF